MSLQHGQQISREIECARVDNVVRQVDITLTLTVTVASAEEKGQLLNDLGGAIDRQPTRPLV
jgi:hypothetical protein